VATTLARRGRRVAAAIAAGLAMACATAHPSPMGERATGPRFRIAYAIAMPDTAEHLYEIRIDVSGSLGDTLRLQMPVWSPGRYARMDFARNVRDESVQDTNGHAVRFDRENGSLWRIYPAGANHVTVRYRVFADNLSGTFSVLDTAHANWNGASLFMYVVGHKPDSVSLAITPPDGWHIINGASTTPDQRQFRFANYDEMIDTPTEVARHFDVDSFTVDNRLYRVVVHHNGSQNGYHAGFVQAVERIVRYENTVIAPPPLKMYTFLFNVGYDGSDGMEHLYSTQIQTRAPWTDSAAVMATVEDAAHEYFHVWNVKRIRPMLLGPFDYSAERYQPSLWVAEGWTQYYGEIGLLRAGLVSTDDYYQTLGGVITANLETPGRKQVSARMASFLAPFWDGAATPMRVDRSGSFFSYYTKGEGLALMLDLDIRGRTHNARSLDDALRALKRMTWDAPNASYYLQGRGYTEDDVLRAASEAAGADLAPWFDRYVSGVDDPPFAEALAQAGLRMQTQAGPHGTEYTVVEDPNATPDQLRVRHGWLTGTVGP
jgi:predicted metalloprotease with PDZ domain